MSPGTTEDEPLILVASSSAMPRQPVAEALRGRRSIQAMSDLGALDSALTFMPDLVLLDLLPPASGPEGAAPSAGLVRAFRAHPSLAGVPILVLGAQDASRLLSEGAHDLVRDPILVPELRARVANLIASKRTRDLLRDELDARSREVRELAQTVADRERQLHAAVSSLRVEQDRAEQSAELKRCFLAVVAHELRTPLTALQLQIERLRRGQDATTLNDEQHRVLGGAASSASRLGALVDSVIEYTELQTCAVATHVERFELGAVVADVFQALKPQAENKPLRYELQVAPNLPPAISDPEHVRAALLHLVANAIKFTDRGTVAVEVSCDRLAHLVRIRDSGPGLSERDRLRLFQPFSTLEPAALKHTPGMGLGLAVVRELADAIGARLEIESEPGRGSTFTLVLPRSPQVRERPRRQPD